MEDVHRVVNAMDRNEQLREDRRLLLVLLCLSVLLNVALAYYAVDLRWMVSTCLGH